MPKFLWKNPPFIGIFNHIHNVKSYNLWTFVVELIFIYTKNSGLVEDMKKRIWLIKDPVMAMPLSYCHSLYASWELCAELFMLVKLVTLKIRGHVFSDKPLLTVKDFFYVNDDVYSKHLHFYVVSSELCEIPISNIKSENAWWNSRHIFWNNLNWVSIKQKSFHHSLWRFTLFALKIVAIFES